ncbi:MULTISPECIES: hypothetical protein [Mesorhizobium]|uniref:Uncharacterized protein n=1 Tax=Mesorhizobium dulcispinae TaxID=3072316 RepID=A0ABU4XLH7_9HYPH|nr:MULTISPECIES: hypothetical protein [unclassified Mesorhizobium]MDX8469032.1 hypothetical protein [Mesorhizobium sp. VK23B]MDX8475428.1 hypothetical protein [Mesorhizobium sp. VK23A]MDX8515504.1 hypothetical protein [Mesorhizobium sp. VK23E]
MGGTPRLRPGFYALLEGFDDLVGDAAVDVLPRGFVGVRHDLAPFASGFSQDAEKQGRAIEPAGQALTRSRPFPAGVVRAGFDRAARLADIAEKIEKNRGNGQIAGTSTRAAGN